MRPDSSLKFPCTSDTDDTPAWYIAMVGYNTEKVVRERIENLGLEAYVATQNVTKVWKNGRKAHILKVVIPMLVFVRCTEAQRRRLVSLPYIYRFMSDRAAKSDTGEAAPPARVTQHDIDTLKYMLGQSDVPVTFVDTPIRSGDRVTIIRGNLRGISGTVITADDNKSQLIVAIGTLGAARISVATDLLKRL
ncbi:MAG: UpxY family transcription antiterminator [Muribaculaceae bacterium]|nr:UpxY family transcription antiterminator [Muribaculaceae bacterium]